MQLAVTIKDDENIERIRPLIEAVRKIFAEKMTVLEAPRDMDYPYSFPVVTVSEGPARGRHFGADAVEVLESLSRM